MVAPVQGGSTSGSTSGGSAAADAAAAAAEAARRAEAARKAAEAARKAAEAAAKAAEAAAKAAAAQKKAAAEASKAAAKPGQSPEESKKSSEDSKTAEKAAQQSAAQASKAKEASEAATKKLQSSEEKVAVTAKRAEEAMVRANKLSGPDKGKPAPFSEKQINEVKAKPAEIASAFDGTSRKNELQKLLGTEAPTTQADTQKKINADKQYDLLSSKPENRETLDKLGIKNGNDLSALGDRLENQAKTGDAPDAKLGEVKDKEALARVIQSAGETRTDEAAKKTLTDPVFAKGVAEGVKPQEAQELSEGAKKLQLTEREATNLVRYQNGRNALRTLAKEPPASDAEKASAVLSIAQQASNIFPPETLQRRLGEVGNRVFNRELPAAKALIDSYVALADPNASGEKKAKAALGLAKAAKDYLGAGALSKLGPELRKADGAFRAAGAGLTLFDPNTKPEDKAIAALQLAGELPGVGRDLKQLKDLLTASNVPNPDAIIQGGADLQDQTLRNLPPEVQSRLNPGQVADIAEAADKVDASELGKAIQNVSDPDALDQVLKQVKDSPDGKAATKFLRTAAALDPKLANEALKNPDMAEKLSKLGQSAIGDLEDPVNQLSDVLKQVKTPEALGNLTDKLASLDPPGDANKLGKVLKGLDKDELDKVLKNSDTLDNVAKMVKGLDGDDAVDALAKTMKNMDADAVGSLSKLGSKVSPDLLNKTIKLLKPVLEKVDSRLVGEGFKLLDKLVGKMGVDLTADVAGKVFKNVAKIIPAVGAVPGLVDAVSLGKEAVELRDKNKDLGYLAMVGSKLNAVDSVAGLVLDATGVGAAVDLGVGAAFGIAELALDIGLSSEKAKMEQAQKEGKEYEAPDWVKAVNLVGAAAQGPAGAVDLVAYYGPKEAFDLAKWGLGKGGELAKKGLELIEKAGGPVVKYAGEAVEALKNAGEAGVEALETLAKGGSEFAKEAAEAAGKALVDMAKLPGEAAKKAAEAIGRAVDSGAQWAKDAATQLLKDGVGVMKDVAKAWANNLTDGAKAVIDGLHGLGDAGVAALKELSSAGGAVAEYTVGRLKDLAHAGVDAAEDALNGLKDLGGKVGDLAGDALGGLGDLAKKALPFI
ncbi:hypothetical protein [Hyalangium versicolor]|uniref:hypothetical protein n=1 Tax=Hyalangium versicolor TaxID=2861190 RepID=UPI001CCD1B5F|nr:hypothetical protein [Hyalangium versicolor]